MFKNCLAAYAVRQTCCPLALKNALTASKILIIILLVVYTDLAFVCFSFEKSNGAESQARVWTGQWNQETRAAEERCPGHGKRLEKKKQQRAPLYYGDSDGENCPQLVDLFLFAEWQFVIL